MPHRLLLMILLVLSPLALQEIPETVAQPSGGIFVDVKAPGNRDLPLALPRAQGGPQAQEFWETLRRDLELSGYFDIIDPDAYVEPSDAGIAPGSFRYSDWDVVQAVVLGKTKIEERNGRLRAEAWIYDVPGASKISGRAFTGGMDQTRRLAHRVADEILRSIGRPELFNTRFAAVNAGSGNKEIYLLDIDGRSPIQITRNRSINIQPSWAPTGDALLFTSYRAGNPDLYVADLVRGVTRRLSSRPGINTGGAWSPLGNLVALTLSVGGDTDLFTIETYTGSQVARLTNTPGIDVSPSWSPEAEQIAFVSERGGGPQIYRIPSAGGAAKRVSFEGGYNVDPCWSPDGKKIAYVTQDKGQFDIAVVDLETNDYTRITRGMGDNEDPTWSPNSEYLAFTSTRSGQSHIWISNAEGTYQVQVTEQGGWSNPAWSPSLPW